MHELHNPDETSQTHREQHEHKFHKAYHSHTREAAADAVTTALVDSAAMMVAMPTIVVTLRESAVVNSRRVDDGQVMTAAVAEGYALAQEGPSAGCRSRPEAAETSTTYHVG